MPKRAVVRVCEQCATCDEHNRWKEGIRMNEQEQRDLGQRLSRIEGQARGIKKMVDAGQDEAAILVQLMAMQKATRAATTFLVKAQAIACIRDQVRAA